MGKINERVSKCSLKFPLIAILIAVIAAGCSQSGVKAANKDGEDYKWVLSLQEKQIETVTTKIEQKEKAEIAEALRLSQERAAKAATEEVRAVKDAQTARAEVIRDSQKKVTTAAVKKAAVEVKAKTQNKSSESSSWSKYKLTHYIAACKGCSGKTATGIDVRHITDYQGYKILSVDPRRIPLGSVVEIREMSGKRYKAIAIDTGGAIKGNKLDLLVGSYQEAISLGRKNVQLRIVRSGW